jgi:hypothetical protein
MESYAAVMQGSEAERASPRWRPIETAPKDGTEILICGGTFVDDNDWTATPWPYGRCSIVRWYDDSWEGEPNHSHDEFRRHEPTHWMPLPPPPAA